MDLVNEPQWRTMTGAYHTVLRSNQTSESTMVCTQGHPLKEIMGGKWFKREKIAHLKEYFSHPIPFLSIPSLPPYKNGGIK